jgi:hypothetical protein
MEKKITICQQRFVAIAWLGLCLNFLRKFIRSFVLVKLSAKFTQLPQAVKRQAVKKPLFLLILQIIHTYKRQYSLSAASSFLSSKL